MCTVVEKTTTLFFLLLICFDLKTVQECFTLSDRAGKFFYVTITCALSHLSSPLRCCFFSFTNMCNKLSCSPLCMFELEKNRYTKESPSVCGEFEFLLWFSFLCLYAKGKLHNFSDEFNFVVHQSENVHCHLWVLCTFYWQKSSGVQTEIAVCGNRQRVYSMHVQVISREGRSWSWFSHEKFRVFRLIDSNLVSRIVS